MGVPVPVPVRGTAISQRRTEHGGPNQNLSESCILACIWKLAAIHSEQCAEQHKALEARNGQLTVPDVAHGPHILQGAKVSGLRPEAHRGRFLRKRVSRPKIAQSVNNPPSPLLILLLPLHHQLQHRLVQA